MTRRRRMIERQLARTDEAPADTVPAPSPQPRASVVRAVGAALTDAAQRIVDIDTALCDPAFVRDRFAGGDDSALISSIKSAGQAVPILVRPHRTRPGRYEIAYGHRRWRACAALGRPVRAVVEPLSDDDLVRAQGRENGERRDLSFIERATFAAALLAHGTTRQVVGEALGVDKTELSRLLSVAKGLPEGLAALIGPAPRTGRPRWMALCAALKDADPAPAFAAVQAAADAHSDARFAAAMAALQPSDPPALPAPFTIKRAGGRTVIAIDETVAPGFGAHVSAELERLYAAFTQRDPPP